MDGVEKRHAQQQRAARRHHAPYFVTKRTQVLHMLDNLSTQDDIERAANRPRTSRFDLQSARMARLDVDPDVSAGWSQQRAVGLLAATDIEHRCTLLGLEPFRQGSV